MCSSKIGMCCFVHSSIVAINEDTACLCKGNSSNVTIKLRNSFAEKDLCEENAPHKEVAIAKKRKKPKERKTFN